MESPHSFGGRARFWTLVSYSLTRSRPQRQILSVLDGRMLDGRTVGWDYDDDSDWEDEDDAIGKQTGSSDQLVKNVSRRLIHRPWPDWHGFR